MAKWATIRSKQTTHHANIRALIYAEVKSQEMHCIPEGLRRHDNELTSDPTTHSSTAAYIDSARATGATRPVCYSCMSSTTRPQHSSVAAVEQRCISTVGRTVA